MAIWLGLMAVLQAGEVPDALIARTGALVSVSARCATRPTPDEVQVCARRRADAYRLPLVDRTAGSRADPTADQRLAAIKPRSECDRLSPFLVGCGSIGVGTHIGSDGKVGAFTARERTPDIAR